MNGGCVSRAPLCVVHWCMSVASPVPSPLRTQVRNNVFKTDSVQMYPTTYYVLEELAANRRVLFDGPPAEVALTHVLAQCGEPLINPVLFGNVPSPGGGCH
jgi:hypothetical protein